MLVPGESGSHSDDRNVLKSGSAASSLVVGKRPLAVYRAEKEAKWIVHYPQPRLSVCLFVVRDVLKNFYIVDVHHCTVACKPVHIKVCLSRGVK